MCSASSKTVETVKKTGARHDIASAQSFLKTIERVRCWSGPYWAIQMQMRLSVRVLKKGNGQKLTSSEVRSVQAVGNLMQSALHIFSEKWRKLWCWVPEPEEKLEVSSILLILLLFIRFFRNPGDHIGKGTQAEAFPKNFGKRYRLVKKVQPFPKKC